MSVCIINHNYADFVGHAVESALQQSHAPHEVVVVDDGSTDDSLERLAEFGGQVGLITQAQAGMAPAMNRAFAELTGDYVLFLDADDFLHPACIQTALSVMTPQAAKTHWRLRLVDTTGQPFGVNPPKQVKLASGDVTDELCRSGTYATVPTSGNLWARWALESVMPVPEDPFRYSGDGYLNLAIPFVGDVVPVAEELSSYRVHDRNRSTQRRALDAHRMRIRLDQAKALDAWLPIVSARYGRHVASGTVLAQPEFHFMRLLAEHGSPSRRSSPVRVLDGLRLCRNVVGTAIRPRRKLLLGAAATVLPLLPRRWAEHVRDVAFGGKPPFVRSRRR